MKQIMIELRDSSDVRAQMQPVCAEWERGIYRFLLLHVFVGWEDEEQSTSLLREIKDVCPEALIVGTMSAGEIRNAELAPQEVLVSAMFFETTSIQVLRFDQVKDHEAEIGSLICGAVDRIPRLKGVELLLPGTELDTQTLFAEIERCRKEIVIFGGYSGSHQLNSPKHLMFDHNGVAENCVFVITYAGKDFFLDVDKTIGWDALGMPFRVTRAEGNRLYELDGKPALEVYDRFLQIDRTKEDNAEAGYEFPLLGRRNGDELLRSIIHFMEDGSLELHGFVTEGMDIYLSYGNLSSIVEKVNERLEAVRKFRPQAILLYSCVVRKIFWKDFVNMEMLPFSKLASTSGFHTWGEVLRSPETGAITEHNVTLLSVAMREGAPQDKPLPRAVVDDTVLLGQASLLKRLTSLVSFTMSELQKAQSDLHILNQRLTQLAERDALTGIYNRGTIDRLMQQALEDAGESGEPLSLIMVDIDYFKRVNDEFGHDTGDVVLQMIARMLQTCGEAIPGGAAGRWGGEEFFVMLPGTDSPAAMETAEKLRSEVAERVFPRVEHRTISVGVITAHGEDDYKDILLRVDHALYQAKERGRNRVVQAE